MNEWIGEPSEAHKQVVKQNIQEYLNQVELLKGDSKAVPSREDHNNNNNNNNNNTNNKKSTIPLNTDSNSNSTPSLRREDTPDPTLAQQLQIQHIIELESKAKQDLEQAIKEDEATQVLLLNDSNESENDEQGRIGNNNNNNNNNNTNNNSTAKTHQLLPSIHS